MSTQKIQIKPSRKKGEKKVEIVLNDELTIYTIESAKDDIIEAVKKYDNIVINGTQIKNMDLTFVQLINSIQKSMEKTKKTLELNLVINDEIKELFENTDIKKIIIK